MKDYISIEDIVNSTDNLNSIPSDNIIPLKGSWLKFGDIRINEVLFDWQNARIQIPDISLDMILDRHATDVTSFGAPRGQYEIGSYNGYHNFLKLYWSGSSRNDKNLHMYLTQCSIIFWEDGSFTVHAFKTPYGFDNCTIELSVFGHELPHQRVFYSKDYNYIYNGVVDNYYTITDTKLEPPIYTVKYLITANSKYFTVVDEALVEVPVNNLTASTFLTYGVDTLPAASLLFQHKNAKLLYWCDQKAAGLDYGLTANYELKYPYNIVNYPSISIPDNKSISTIMANERGGSDALYTVSFDYGSSWKYHDGVSWQTAENANDGMYGYSMEALGAAEWNQVQTSATLQIQAVLPYTGTVAADKIYYQFV